MMRIEFLGDALDRLGNFQVSARKESGVQLHKVQLGIEPSDWKPISGRGQGVREIRVRDDAGAFRVIYVIRRAEIVYVLHAFQKKTQQTPKRDLDLARSRLGEI